MLALQCRHCSGLGLATARQGSCGVLHLHAQESPSGVQGLNAAPAKPMAQGGNSLRGWEQVSTKPRGCMSPQGQGQQLSLSPATEQQ